MAVSGGACVRANRKPLKTHERVSQHVSAFAMSECRAQRFAFECEFDRWVGVDPAICKPKVGGSIPSAGTSSFNGLRP